MSHVVFIRHWHTDEYLGEFPRSSESPIPAVGACIEIRYQLFKVERVVFRTSPRPHDTISILDVTHIDVYVTKA